MANIETDVETNYKNGEQLRLNSFHISGLLGGDVIDIEFPRLPEDKSQASILILQGRNGVGKTTILRMISGMLRLEFDVFRKIPFKMARLSLSDGSELVVEWRSDNPLPLLVMFGANAAELAAEKLTAQYSQEQAARIEALRGEALPVLGGIQYELLGTDRSAETKTHKIKNPEIRQLVERQISDEDKLSEKVKRFIREAQINHRRFFRTEELGVFPNLLRRLAEQRTSSPDSNLLARVEAIRESMERTKRFELALNEDEVVMLSGVLDGSSPLSQQQMLLIETYVEMLELAHQYREPLIKRLLEFEQIMGEFLLGKRVTVDSRNGFRIVAGKRILDENSLSSGEYHFLYMMVSALLCQRIGSIIAIDEPELSLHVKWQRKLLAALSRCASGASPLFICATHSLAISAEHADQVKVLTAVD